MGAVNCIGRNLIGMETRIVPPGSTYEAGDTEPDWVSASPEATDDDARLRGPGKTAANSGVAGSIRATSSSATRTGTLPDGARRRSHHHRRGNDYPLEIEQVLVESPQVADCAAVGVPDRSGARSWPRFSSRRVIGDARGIGRFAEGRLATHKRPRRWAVIDAIPRNPSGKVLLRESRARTSILREIAEIR